MDNICKLRDIYRSIAHFETEFEQRHGLCLNEGMLLCTLSNSGQPLSSGELSDLLGLTASNTSKVIKSVEIKGYIVRTLGDEDKRQMYFTLTEAGKEKLKSVKCGDIQMPDTLRSILEVL